MSLEIILFIVFGGVAAVTSVLMITRPNPFISALFLVLNFTALAGLYLLLNAQFIAVAQVVVYAGAIMVLFLFVIMLLKPEQEGNIFSTNPMTKIIASFVAGVVFLQIVYMIFYSAPAGTVAGGEAASINAGTIESIGGELFTNYILPFEAVGYLLLSAAIGALVLAKKKFE